MLGRESLAPLRDAVNTFPYEGKGDRVAVDEVRNSHEHPLCEHPRPYRAQSIDY